MSTRCTCGARSSWVVSMRNHNRSAFNGYRKTPSAYSTVRCKACGAAWRTKAKYVNDLPDLDRRGCTHLNT